MRISFPPIGGGHVTILIHSFVMFTRTMGRMVNHLLNFWPLKDKKEKYPRKNEKM